MILWAVLLLVNTELAATQSPEYGLDAAGNPVNNTDLLRMSDEEINFDYWKSIEERKGCSPTISCTRAGGYCIKGRASCNGTVDRQGCRGGKKCKCCIPDETTSTPATCPAVTCTPCPTTPMTTEDRTTSAPPTTVMTTEDRTTSAPPTTVMTTEGITPPSNLKWLTVGADRFVRFTQEMNWSNARTLCRNNGLDLYEPRNILVVATYLDDNFDDKWYWIGARGNGTHQVWLSGAALTRTDPWYGTYYQHVGTNYCVELITHSGIPAKGTTLAGVNCISRTNCDVLCG